MSIRRISFQTKIINSTAAAHFEYPEDATAEDLVCFGSMLVKQLQQALAKEEDDSPPTVDEILGLLKISSTLLEDIEGG
jgi:hypothetical protein